MIHITVLIFVCFIFACAKPLPVSHGNLVIVSKPTVSKPGNDSPVLSIHWFGTANYYMRLGDVAILTDPFVSYQGIFRIVFSGYIHSDPGLVKSFFEPLKSPNAIFIGHSHYDHMLDTVEALKLPGWGKIPVYGSETTKHIMAGYKKDVVDASLLERKWSENWCQADTSGGWKEITSVKSGLCKKNSGVQPYRIFYKAFEAEHAPHLPPDFKYFSGEVKSDLVNPPWRADDFKVGETYVYIFKFTRSDEEKEVSYTVALVGTATELPDSFKSDLPVPVDILILCVPGWQYVNEYPGNFIKALKPRIIILSHYDNFFEPNRYKRPVLLLPTSKFYKFLNVIQDEIKNNENEYDKFEKILIPDVGTTLYFTDK